MNEKQFINIGIVAHVDAGKTSISELMMFKSGLIRSIGSVDKGSSQTDWLDIERERGISVRAASASFQWNGINVNIIDTPGHTDFSSEVERSLRALDCVILVISAVEGVQSNTENIWEALNKLNIPTIIFINKIDRIGSDFESTIKEITKELYNNICVLQKIDNEASSDVEISSLLNNPINGKYDDRIIESIANKDDILLEKYLSSEDISLEELKLSLKRQIQDTDLYAVLTGSAKYDLGINELMDFITDYMPFAKSDITDELSAVVYKIEHDKNIGKIASVRLFSGQIKNRDLVYNINQANEEKVSQIRKLQGQKYSDVGEVVAGDIAALCGLSKVKAGDFLGKKSLVNEKIDLNAALLTIKIKPKDHSLFSDLVRALHILSDEDPHLDLLWMKDERELHIKIMGLIQLEVLESVLLQRFNLEVEYGEPTIIYKETIAKSGIAFEEYTMPKPCWAVVKFMLEPGKRGSGVVYESKLGVNEIAYPYQQETERAISVALNQGVLGWEVTDIKITLIGGEDHNVHSRAGDFMVATPMALMKAFKQIGTKLLEPILDFKIKGPEDSLGKVASHLSICRAELNNPMFENDKFLLTGRVPLSTSLDLSTKLNSISGGKTKIKTTFSNYQECSIENGDTTDFRGVNPLDRAKYILKARKALQ